MFKRVYSDRRVLVTGHTGFQGSWLSAWLLALEARVSGLGLDPNAKERLFNDLGLPKKLASDHRVDMRDAGLVARVIEHVEPDFIFHLAGRRVMRQSIAEPVETFATNVMGTVNLLEAVRRTARNVTVVVVTSDKVYECRDVDNDLREDAPLGGRDATSASQAGMELAVAAYRRTYFSEPFAPRVATARAGDAVGGGDWEEGRLVPDAIRALRNRQSVPVRNQAATRPWQHILEPLSGYLWLGVTLERPELLDRADATELCSAFNFGPEASSERTVAELVNEIFAYMPGRWVDAAEAGPPVEADRCPLSIEKAQRVLGWRPVWDFGETVRETVSWYQAQSNGKDLMRTSIDQIRRYETAATAAGQPWTA